MKEMLLGQRSTIPWSVKNNESTWTENAIISQIWCQMLWSFSTSVCPWLISYSYQRKLFSLSQLSIKHLHLYVHLEALRMKDHLWCQIYFSLSTYMYLFCSFYQLKQLEKKRLRENNSLLDYFTALTILLHYFLNANVLNKQTPPTFCVTPCIHL